MDIQAAREVVYKRKAALEGELARGPSPYEKRLILLNLNACGEMLCYLDMLAMGMKPKFFIKPEFEINVLPRKTEIIVEA